jgi:release factor glutamine methyltransferase
MAEKLQTISEIRLSISGILKKSWPEEEAEAMATVIISEYTGLSGARQLAFGEMVTGADTAGMITAAALRASAGEPLQYIFGYTTFCGHRINIKPGVLIPRPETEEMTLMIINENMNFSGTAADLCTGSGCIAISLSLAFTDAKILATENSETALMAASANISATGARVTLMKGDILKHEPPDLPPCDLIVSNPPYVTEKEKKLMHINVVDYEPHEALFVPDNDPQKYYRPIAEMADSILVPGGIVWLEINESHAEQTAGLFSNALYREVRIIEDIRGKKRFIKALKHGSEK